MLRSQSGLTVRELAKLVDAPVATLGDYFAGRHLPGPRQLDLYRSILSFCSVVAGDQEAWVAALIRARLASDARSPKGAPPYRGLEPFRQSDVELFFGRQSAVEDLLTHLRRLRDSPTGPGGIVMLVGPSGSGKSSLLMAGLLPAVAGGALDENGAQWTCVAASPVELPASAGPAPAAGDGKRLVVLVDQVEELFALPDGGRAAAIGAVDRLRAGGALVVLGLRADFYGVAIAEPVLLETLRRSQVLLAPMTEAEVREAVLGPAGRTGAAVEEGLVELVLADLLPGSPQGFAHAPGALPLLSYALLTTWERAPRNYLTIADYRAVGGLRGAVRQGAERLFGSLSRAEQEVARRMFTRLVLVEGDGPPMRRRASRRELLDLDEAGEDNVAVSVLERFVGARLLTAETDTVTISHEALLSAWPRLNGWVEEDRDWLRLHNQLAPAAAAWAEAGKDESMLLVGARLESVLDRAGEARHGRQLNRTEQEFLDRSVSWRGQQQRAARRRTRRMYQLLGVVTVLAVVAVVFAGVAVGARDSARLSKDQALSRQVAIEAAQLQPTDPSLAAQLALIAYQISPTVQARSALVDATAGEIPTRLLGPSGPEFVSVSGNGDLLAVAQSATDTVALYRLGAASPSKLAVVPAGPSSDQDFTVALSPNGSLLAAGGTDDEITLWSLGSPTAPQIHLRKLAELGGFTSTVYSVAFSSNGLSLAAADNDGTVRQWSLANPDDPLSRPVLHAPGAPSLDTVAYSPDGRLIAAGGANGALLTWREGSSTPSVASGAGSTTIEGLAFSPDGNEIATVGADADLRVWKAAPSGALRLVVGPIKAATSELNSAVFSPNGSTLAVTSADGSIHLYSTATWSPTSELEAPNPVTSAVFTPDGHSLVTGDAGGVTRIWSVPSPATYTEAGPVYYLGYVDGGRELVAGTSGPRGDVSVWGVEAPLRLVNHVNINPPASFGVVAGAAAASPNGQVVAVADARALLQLYDLSDLARPALLGPPLSGNEPYIEQVGFSPNGKLLAASDNSGQVRMWNVSDPARPVVVPTLRGSTGQVLAFAFSNNSRFIATASTDFKVRLYDIANPEHPVMTATLGGFSNYAYDTAFTPNGRTLIACSADGTIRMWNISDPEHPKLLGQPLTGPTGYVWSVDVSPDGRTLGATTTSGQVWLWNITDPARPRLEDTLTAAQDSVFSLIFSPDSRTLVASGSDDLLTLWSYQPAEAANLVCSLAGDPITRGEWAQYIQGAPYHPPCR